MSGRALDLFAGPGGWDVAADRLGVETDGVELDPAAQLTRAAAGHKTIHDDVTTLDIPLPGEYDGLIASPPCQSFSAAGKRKGLEDPRGQLVFQVMRYAKEMKPSWIACEQVPGVLPIWQQFAIELEGMGYSTWAGNMHAEQHGVPQTRKRAILIASLDQKVAPTTPTHSKYHSRSPEKLDEGVLKWVSMAEALGMPIEGVAQRSNYNGHSLDAAGNRERAIRPLTVPSSTVTSKAAHWIVTAGITGQGRPRSDSAPAPTLTGKGTAYWLKDPNHWGHSRPATTVQGDPRIGRPGHKCMTPECHPGQEPEAQFARDSVRVTVEEAAILQSFSMDYPWQGTKSQQYQQVGNAIPPLLAEAVLKAVVI